MPGRPQQLLTTIFADISLDLVADIARRLLAVECSQFLRGANPRTERWLPYRVWAHYLRPGDTIVSFNYDRALELLCAWRKQNSDTSYQVNFEVITPDGDLEQKIHRARQFGAPALKLHGSVDWIATDETISVDPADDLPATCKKGNQLVLAVPGPNKAGLLGQFKAIAHLWHQAQVAVSKAQRIVFLGYRFPPTDARARIELLDAILASVEENLLKQVQVVLGPDDQHQDVLRMRKLLGYVCPEDRVDVVPLYVEDFLSLHWAVAPVLAKGR